MGINEIMIDLSICIVNWNTGALLSRCVESILSNVRDISYEIFVIDNKSSDNSIEMCISRFAQDPHLRFLPQSANLGFAAGNNIALKQASGRYVVLLNPDTIVKPGSFETVVKFMDANPSCGVVGPKLLNEDGSIQRSVGNFPDLAAIFWEATRLRIVFPKVKMFSSFKRFDLDYDKLQEVDQPSGACLFVRREAIQQVGLLDEGYFMYYEDLDWCYRIKHAGWRIYYLPDAEVVHLGGQSSQLHLDVRIVENARSKLRYFEKHYSSRPLYRLLIRVIMASEALAKIILCLGGLISSQKRELAKRSISKYLAVVGLTMRLPNNKIIHRQEDTK